MTQPEKEHSNMRKVESHPQAMFVKTEMRANFRHYRIKRTLLIESKSVIMDFFTQKMQIHNR